MFLIMHVILAIARLICKAFLGLFQIYLGLLRHHKEADGFIYDKEEVRHGHVQGSVGGM